MRDPQTYREIFHKRPRFRHERLQLANQLRVAHYIEICQRLEQRDIWRESASQEVPGETDFCDNVIQNAELSSKGNFGAFDSSPFTLGGSFGPTKVDLMELEFKAKGERCVWC